MRRSQKECSVTFTRAGVEGNEKLPTWDMLYNNSMEPGGKCVCVLSAPPVFPFANHHFLWQKLQLSLFWFRNRERSLRMSMLRDQTEVILLF